jgi:hypothetical protein
MEGRLFSDVVDKFVRARANGYFDNIDEDGFPISLPSGTRLRVRRVNPGPEKKGDG